MYVRYPPPVESTLFCMLGPHCDITAKLHPAVYSTPSLPCSCSSQPNEDMWGVTASGGHILCSCSHRDSGQSDIQEEESKDDNKKNVGVCGREQAHASHTHTRKYHTDLMGVPSRTYWRRWEGRAETPEGCSVPSYRSRKWEVRGQLAPLPFNRGMVPLLCMCLLVHILTPHF